MKAMPQYHKFDCPLKKVVCPDGCPYKKQGSCDFPFLGRVRAYPDKVTK